MRGNACTNGVQFYVSIALQNIVLAVHQAGLEPSFPQRSGSFHAEVEEGYVSATEGLHEPTDTTGLAGRGQEVDVVAHEDVCMNLALEFFGQFEQVSEIFPVMHFQDEARAPVDTSLDDVLGYSGKIESGWSGHGRTMAVGRQ